MRGPFDQTSGDQISGDRAGSEVGGAPPPVGRLKRRADFLRVGKGRRWHGKAMTMQAAPRLDGALEARVGFTLTKKVGCAVVRNRARRRLREAVRLSPELPLRPGNDYVVVGRLDAIRLPFAELVRELARAVAAVHRGADGAARGAPAGLEGRRRGKADRPRPDGADDPKSAKGVPPGGGALERTRFTP